MKEYSREIKISDHWIFRTSKKFLVLSEILNKFTARPFNSQRKAKTAPYRAHKTTYGNTGAVWIRPDFVNLCHGEVGVCKKEPFCRKFVPSAVPPCLKGFLRSRILESSYLVYMYYVQIQSGLDDLSEGATTVVKYSWCPIKSGCYLKMLDTSNSKPLF